MFEILYIHLNKYNGIMTWLEEAKQQIREAFERAKRERLAKEARNNCIKNESLVPAHTALPDRLSLFLLYFFRKKCQIFITLDTQFLSVYTSLCYLCLTGPNNRGNSSVWLSFDLRFGGILVVGLAEFWPAIWRWEASILTQIQNNLLKCRKEK